MTCDHMLGRLVCDNAEPHEGGEHGHGCTHTDGSFVRDAHSESSHE
jgi:hypothetical protein